MLINSELPLCMLRDNENLNDYDFVLFHLYKNNKRYREYFNSLRNSNPDRLMILDNSAYEFFINNEEFNEDDFYNTILELKPDMYILPDALMDKNETIKRTEQFLKKYNIPFSEPIAVLQGTSVAEMLDCMYLYNYIGVTNIAIPFHNNFFKELGEHCNMDIHFDFLENYKVITDDIKYAMGRVQFMRHYGAYFEKFKHVHLLGSHCPLEKIYYKDYHTMDTGYPVKCGYVGYELFKESHKPNIIIDEFLDKMLPEDTMELITKNVLKFKNL